MMDHPGLQMLLDRAAISDTSLRYDTGIDRRDWRLYRSIFADTIEVDFSSWSGVKTSMPADDWVAMLRETLSGLDATHYNITNHVATIGDDVAEITAYLVVWHSFNGELQILGGYYAHRLHLDTDGWKINVCTLVITWEQGDRALFDRAKASRHGTADMKPPASENQE